MRGPLHGIPVLVKDNIATDDNMETTAGSLALVGSRVPADAHDRRPAAARRGRDPRQGEPLGVGELPRLRTVQRLERPGRLHAQPLPARLRPVRVELGLGGRAGGEPVRGRGRHRDRRLDRVPGRATTSIVGLKPTVGLMSQDGIIPIAHSQDTAGPMARTVTDAAILLGVLQTPFGPVADHAAAGATTRRSSDAAPCDGARIGVDRRYFTPDYGGEPDIDRRGRGRRLASWPTSAPRSSTTDTGDPFAYFDAEFTVLLFEFKVQIAEYLATLGHTAIRTLADLIAFNERHCAAEMKYFGQEIFELGRGDERATSPTRPISGRALRACNSPARRDRRGARPPTSSMPSCAELLLRVVPRGSRGLSEYLRADRPHQQRRSGGNLDVRGSAPRGEAAALGVRHRARA